MKKFWKKKSSTPAAAATQLRKNKGVHFSGLGTQTYLGGKNAALYRGIRQNIPILDSAVDALVRLTGGFTVTCTTSAAQKDVENFIRTVPIGHGQYGLDKFIAGYTRSLLTYGHAIGEMITSPSGISAVFWGDVTALEIREGNTPLDITICGPGEYGRMEPLPQQELLLFAALNPEPGNPYGNSLFHSMPFLADILMKIYETMGRSWQQAGNLRYSVVYKPGCENIDQETATEQLTTLANQWSRAAAESTDDAVRDFVAVGDVEIKVIGADGPILDSEVPVNQILDQLVAKTGLPPALLGIKSNSDVNWQRAEVLTAQLWEIRNAVTPVLERVIGTFLRLRGWDCEYSITWEAEKHEN